MVNRTGLFKLLEKIGCSPKLLSIIASFHVNMYGTVSFNGEISEPFKIDSGAKQGCPGFHTFWDFLLLDAYLCLWYSLRWHLLALQTWWQIVQLETATSKDQSHLCPHKRNAFCWWCCADQRHTRRPSVPYGQTFEACKGFAFTINIKKTEVMAQDAEISPSTYIDGFNLSVVDIFKYLGSTISSNLSLDMEINACIWKAATVMAKLNKMVWQNISLTMNTRLKLYQASVTSILLYGSETWTPYARQEAKWIHSICVASDEFWVSIGRTEFQTPLRLRRPNAQAYMFYSVKDALDGRDTYAEWKRKDSKGPPVWW